MTLVWKNGIVRQMPTTMQINAQYRCIVIGLNSGFTPTVSQSVWWVG